MKTGKTEDVRTLESTDKNYGTQDFVTDITAYAKIHKNGR